MQINEFDHPDHGWKWRACELRWIEAKIAEAVVAAAREKYRWTSGILKPAEFVSASSGKPRSNER